MAVSRKRKKLPKIRWCQNSRIVEGFHPLFYESDLAPLSHPLSALFFEGNRLFRVFSGCFRFPMISEKRSEYGPDTFFHVGKNKIAVPAKTSAELQNL